MKKILFTLLLVLSATAYAAPCELRINQRDSTDATTFMRSVPPVSCATNSVMTLNGSTGLPAFVTLGTGLSFTSGALTVTPAWSSLTGVPSTFAPSAHTHPATDINDSTSVGRSVLTASDAPAARTAIGAGTSNFSGAYGDLTSIPSTFAPSAHTHPASQISDSTTVGRALVTATDTAAARSAIGAGTSSFSGAYADLSGIPGTFAPAAHTHVISDVTGLQTALDGKVPNTRTVNGHALSADVTVTKGDVGLGNADNTSDANKPISTATQTALNGKVPTTRTVNGHALSSDVTVTQSDVGLGNVDNTSDANKPISTATQTALNGKFANPTGTTSQVVLGNGTLGTLPVIPAQVIGEPSRAIVTSTSATGYQISATRNALACYEGVITTTSSIGGPSSGSIFLETANTNSTTPADWTTKAEQTNSQTLTLAIVLQSVDGESWSFCRIIPAGKYVRLRSVVTSGTVTFSINASQQETLF